ncbi:MAG TPA: orotidine-5'-phosphate decarboxylase [Patescibacteria group bacterium]|nr:orotidine-5'-phosphate decarboxylase [Patescibacteria group bacterium]
MKARFIVALDVDSLAEARYFVNTLYPRVGLFKVGMQLFTACGPGAVAMINKKGGQVFLDLKFHDIPNTVACAVRQAVRLGVRMLTVHISGGPHMLKAAVDAARQEAGLQKAKRPLVIGVTVLTSQATTPRQVLRLAKAGIDAGLDGVVCSAREARFLRRSIKNDFIIITPGIRSKTAGADDQKRTATAEEAQRAGSDFLVVGRPVLKADDPLAALKELS